MVPTHISTGRELWNWRVQQTPGKLFLRCEQGVWTYAEFDEAKARYAAALAELGVGPGAAVLVGMRNTPRALLVHIALMQLGAVAVPLQCDLAFEELRHQIEHSRAEVLLIDGPATATLLPRIQEFSRVRHIVTGPAVPEPRGGVREPLRGRVRHIVTGPAVPEPRGGVREPLRGRGPDAEPPPAAGSTFEDWESREPLDFQPIDGHDARSPAMVLYTSGSSGRPKGVVLGAGAFVSSGAGFAEHFGFTGEDVYFLPLTLAHAVGALVAPAMAVAAGGGLALVDRFSPAVFWRQVERFGATCSILFPTHLNLLTEAEHDAPGPGESDLRLVITHAWNEGFATRFGVELATVWGMTETGAMATGSAPGAARGREPGYVGTPMPDVEVAMFSPDGERLPRGAVGEIRLRHPHVMLEYLRDPGASARTLVDGWVRSGDEGVVREDGSVYFLGRRSNMIKRSGENISPDEVVDALLTHSAAVEAIVFGVADEIRSEEVAAVVMTRSAVDPGDLLTAAAEHLSARKLPRYLKLSADHLPRLSNGKMDRARIVREFSKASAWDRFAGRGESGPEMLETPSAAHSDLVSD
ncbi:class I adenylate-forming enzyme family protein [Saccharopolyspora sp. NPDC000995]